jgi:hypothetical protein
VHHARVVRDHAEKLAALLQRSDDLRAPAFEHSHHHPGVRGVVLRAHSDRANLTAHQDPIVVHGDARVGRSNRDLAEPRVVGQEEAAPLTSDLDASGDEIGFPRTLELIELVPQALRLPGRQFQRLHELGRIGRHVVLAPE